MRPKLIVAILMAFVAWQAFAQTSDASGQEKVFVFVQRTQGHIKHSDATVFQTVIDDLLATLREKNVSLAELKGTSKFYSDFPTELDKVFEMAREAGATSVLYVVVDRPISKWLKVTMQCFDLDRKQLWKEEAASGGGFSGGHGLEVTTKRIHEDLARHIGQPGLAFSADPRTTNDKGR
ncbi:MAG TPA: hypothetical protein VN577_09820 [Terriglobales bacterium]|nr:hypothetical protein [Terriglobales bacterium]